eukprot:6509247-Alexandrium_andersonii.AAC.1
MGGSCGRTSRTLGAGAPTRTATEGPSIASSMSNSNGGGASALSTGRGWARISPELCPASKRW